MDLHNFQNTSFYKNSDFIPQFSEKIEELENWIFLANQFENWEKNQSNKIAHKIPKIIHQIWIGSPFPEKYKQWAESWKIKNKHWDYILWTEEKIVPLCNNEQKKWFYTTKNFGPKSDLARLLILEKFGGIYCDTDFECLKSMDLFINTTTFFAGTIFSANPEIANGIVGSIPNHPLIQKTLKQLTAKTNKTNKTIAILNETGPAFFTKILLQNKNDWTSTDVIFPTHYLYPFPNFEDTPDITLNTIHEKFIKQNSYAIHYWDKSWMVYDSKWLKNIKKIIKLLIFYKYWKKQ